MGTLRKRNGKYQMIVEVYRGGRRYFKSKTFRTDREAKTWEKKFLYEIDTGLVTKESLKRRKLSDAIKKYIEQVLPQKPKNARNVTQHLRWWDEQIGGLELSEVGPAALAECRDRLLSEIGFAGKVRSANTVIRYIASIGIVLEYCVKEWMWMNQNPIRSIKKPKAGHGKTRIFDHDEIQRVRSLCETSGSSYLLSIFTLGLHTGMRKGEILSLRLKNIDFKNRELNLPTSKNGEPRDIPMTGEVFNILSRLVGNGQTDRNGLLFPSPNDPQKPVNLQSAWERVLCKAGIADATFHTLRHTACSFLAQLGISPVLISRIVGHKDSRTTDRYTHAVKSHIRAAMSQLENLIQNG
jgi:integrase